MDKRLRKLQTIADKAKKLRHDYNNERQRLHLTMVVLYREGVTVKDIAVATGYGASYVYRVIEGDA